MTKELESLLNELNIQNYNLYSAIFDELTTNNVCIPKGDNRHLYADVLHEWIEGTSKQLEWFNNNYQDTSLHEWVIMPDRLIYIDKKMRIKPHEPVYEYIWYNVDGDTKWMTLDEAKEFERPWFWAKETSRMRQ